MRWFIQGFGQFLTPLAQRFYQSLDQPQATQQRVQRQICDRLIASDYGQHLGIRSIRDWQHVPIVTYTDLEPWILPSVGAIPHSHLTPEPILFYEKTSGTSGTAKLIPYTRSLRRSFNHLFCLWAHDLIHRGPAFSTGKLYFCISPQFSGCANDPSGDPSRPLPTRQLSQLQNDADYLDPWLQLVLSPFLVSPKAIHQLRTPEAFKWQVCQTLLQAERLETISIWSPSFLKILLDFIYQHRQILRQELSLSTQRDRLLAEPEIPWPALWPHLKLISCWDSVAAADSAAGLRSRFPGVLVQGKGLLATEAPLTIPLIAAAGYVPVLDQVFFEFADATGNCYWLHELQVGQEYTIIVSQKAGLYRYRIGDRVRVTHIYRQTPCLEFLGRTPSISDLVGEKLSDEVVQTTLHDLGLEPSSFKSLVPVQQPHPHYVLLLERSPTDAAILAEHLDHLLCRLPHYRHARLLGQLNPPQVYCHDRIAELLTQYRSSSGTGWGNIKHPVLVKTAIGHLQELEVVMHSNVQ